MRNLGLPSIILLGGGIIIAALILTRPKPEAAPPPGEPALVAVDVTGAEPQSVQLTVTTFGTVRPKNEINVIAQVSGQITAVEPVFLEGGFFSKEATLLTIDDRDYQSALLSAKARLAEAERLFAQEQGMAQQARREWRDLGDSAANDLFVRKPQLAAALANLEAARGGVYQAELDLQRTRISVPFNGRIKQVHANLGQYVAAGAPLATVYASDALEIIVSLTENQARLLHLPLKPEPAWQAAAVKVRANIAGIDHQWLGRLTRTQAFVDDQSRLIHAIVEVDDPFAAAIPLLPGVFAQVEIPGRQLEDVLVLPRAALYQNNTLYTLDDANRIQAHQVTVLKKDAEQVWVQSDIRPGIQIALEKQVLLAVGKAVAPRPGAQTAKQGDAPNTEGSAAAITEPSHTGG